MKIINHILDNPDDKDFDASPMLHGQEAIAIFAVNLKRILKIIR